VRDMITEDSQAPTRRVIDFRFRVPTPPFEAAAAAAHRSLWWNPRSTPLWRHAVEPAEHVSKETSVAECVAWMRQRQVVGVLPGRDMPGVRIPNEHLRELCVEYPDCFRALAGIDASQRRAAMDEIQRCVDWGFAGVQLEPGWLQPPMTLDDPRLYPIYAQCEDLDTIVVAHVGPIGGPTLDHGRPDAIGRVARDFPGLRIVIAHGAFPHADEAIMTVFDHANIWLAPDPYHDFPGGERYRQWAHQSDLIADRLLYGSSFGWPRAPDALARFSALGWREDVLERVLWSNAAALLGL
jgi:predicted TIM-barrel fold metal-dependent hydrolase